MHPILVKLGPLEIRWYGALIAIGFLVAYRLFRKRAAPLGLDESRAGNLLILLLLSGVAGARLYYVILNWKVRFGGEPSFAEAPWTILAIHRGGIVFFGGFLLAGLVLAVWSRLKKIPLAPLADALAVPLAAAHVFGRLGCFMNGCCHGRECSLPWAVRLEAPPEIAGVPVHPTQLYEAFGLFYIVLALLFIERLRRYPGQVALSYFMLYGVLRFIVEFFRGDVPRVLFGQRFTVAQGISVAVFLFGWLVAARLTFLRSQARIRQALKEARQAVRPPP